jgi:hypothetical protein
MEKERRFGGKSPHTEVKRPGEGNPRAKFGATHMSVKMQSFLTLGQEILLSHGGALGELPVEELFSMRRQHLAPTEECAERRNRHGDFAATTGVLRATPADKEEGWRCKVQTCTGEHHNSRIAPSLEEWTQGTG